MDSLTGPSAKDSQPTLSSDPNQQARPTDQADSSTKNITARDTVPSSAEGTAGSEPRATDGPKSPDPDPSEPKETGVEYKSHTEGTAAPGSHSALFGLTPGEKVHPPPGSGPGSGVLGTTGHKGTHNSIAGQGGTSGQTNTQGNGENQAKPSLLDRLNPLKDTDRDEKKGVGH